MTTAKRLVAPARTVRRVATEIAPAKIGNKAPNGCILRRRIDIGPATFVLAIAVVQTTLFLQASALIAVLGATLLWPMQTRSIYIAHNHHHHRSFRPRWLNLTFETLLFLQTGLPSFGFALHHNFGHHRLYRNQHPEHPDADPHCWLDSQGRRLGRWTYTWRVLRTAVPAARRIGRHYRPLWRNFLFAAACYGVGTAALLAARPLHALAVFIVPMALGLVALAWSTYVHHLGLATQEPLSASYTNLDAWANRWGYNIGYHTAHHARPGRHWSELPQLHARIADRVPQHCYYDGRVTAYTKLHWPRVKPIASREDGSW